MLRLLREYIRQHDKAASRLAPKGRDGRFDFYVAMNWRKKSRDVKIEHLPDVARATGQEPFLQYRFAMPSRKAQPFERVATTGDVDKDGNTFLVGIVLTATSTKALKVAEPAYLAILNGYK